MLALVHMRIPAPKGGKSRAISGAVWLLQTGFVRNSRLKRRGWWTMFIAESGLRLYLFGKLSFLGLDILSFKSLMYFFCDLVTVQWFNPLLYLSGRKFTTVVVAF